jgi:hypothetical protein
MICGRQHGREDEVVDGKTRTENSYVAGSQFALRP